MLGDLGGAFSVPTAGIGYAGSVRARTGTARDRR